MKITSIREAKDIYYEAIYNIADVEAQLKGLTEAEQDKLCDMLADGISAIISDFERERENKSRFTVGEVYNKKYATSYEIIKRTPKYVTYVAICKEGHKVTRKEPKRAKIHTDGYFEVIYPLNDIVSTETEFYDDSVF